MATGLRNQGSAATGEFMVGPAERSDPAPGFNTAHLTIARFSGDGDRLLDDYRQYSDTMTAVGRDHGLILHAGAKTDDGFLVINLWPSKEESEAAARDPRRLAVLQRSEITPEQLRREHHEVANYVLF